MCSWKEDSTGFASFNIMEMLESSRETALNRKPTPGCLAGGKPPFITLLLMDKILHDPKDPKLWELWYIPYNG